MLERKAPYYPRVILTSTETRFGAIESNNPTLYDTPLSDKIILKVDTLDVLKDIWGETILMSREKTYKLVSGHATDDEYRKLLASYYAKYSGFCNYVTDKYVFGDNSIPLISRIVDPVRKMIDTHSSNVAGILVSNGGKFLMRTHDYLYYAFRTSDIPEIRGSTRIC